MGFLPYCLSHNCCNRRSEDDGDTHDERGQNRQQQRGRRRIVPQGVRPPPSARILRYRISPARSNDEEEDNVNVNSSRPETVGVERSTPAGMTDGQLDGSQEHLIRCQPLSGRTRTSSPDQQRGDQDSDSEALNTKTLDFFRRLRKWWNFYIISRGAVDGACHETSSVNAPDEGNEDDFHMRNLRLSRKNSNSATPLKTASSFNASRETTPTINPNTIILPGSDLQRKMAELMMTSPEFSRTAMKVEDECVICMEGFTPENPRMPTLCGCGENKAYFHLPCLYQWIDQDRHCPICRKKLQWEEF